MRDAQFLAEATGFATMAGMDHCVRFELKDVGFISRAAIDHCDCEHAFLLELPNQCVDHFGLLKGQMRGMDGDDDTGTCSVSFPCSFIQFRNSPVF